MIIKLKKIRLTKKVIIAGLAFGMLIAYGGASLALQTSTSSNLYDGHYWSPESEGIKSPDSHGLQVGYTGNDKRVVNSSTVTVSNLPGSRYGVIETTVKVQQLDTKGQVMRTVEGKALHVSDMDNASDNGYVLVDQEEADEWIRVLNGNHAYVFRGSAITTHVVKDKETGDSYTAYNLAEIATECGGAGGDYGFVKTWNGYDKWNAFKATPLPDGEVDTDKDHYILGEKVKINYKVNDYSIYDKGIHIHNLSVIHTTTGRGYQSFIQDKVVSPSTYNNTYDPQETGVYQVSLLITDRHRRSRAYLPNMNASTLLPAPALTNMEEKTKEEKREEKFTFAIDDKGQLIPNIIMGQQHPHYKEITKHGTNKMFKLAYGTFPTPDEPQGTVIPGIILRIDDEGFVFFEERLRNTPIKDVPVHKIRWDQVDFTGSWEKDTVYLSVEEKKTILPAERSKK